VLRDGKVLARYHKSLLPNYEVFDEERYFEAGGTGLRVRVRKGVRFGLNICADVWERGPAEAARAAGRRCCWRSTPRPTT
jgi:NAD+ synthase (glutamine-hydrolysing)